MAAETFLLADRLFDGTRVRDDTAVGVIGSTISRVVPASEVPHQAVCHRLDGATLTPGLIDAHVHMCPWMVFGLIAAGLVLAYPLTDRRLVEISAELAQRRNPSPDASPDA